MKTPDEDDTMDIRFSNLELDDEPSVPTAVVVDAGKATPAKPMFGRGDVRSVAAIHGASTYGGDHQVATAKDADALMVNAGETLRAHIDRIKNEERRTDTVPRHWLYVDRTGQLRSDGRSNHWLDSDDRPNPTNGEQTASAQLDTDKPTIDELAWRQLASFSPNLNDTNRNNVNSWLCKSEKPIQIATRKLAKRERRQTYRVSTKYAEFSSGQVAKSLLDVVPIGSKGTINYDEDSTRAMFRFDFEKFSPGADDHELRFWVDTADNKSRLLRCGLGAVRCVCSNGMIIADWAFTTKFRHTGDTTTFQKVIKNILSRTGLALREFNRLWVGAQGAGFKDLKGNTVEPVQALRALVGTGRIKVPNESRADLFAKFKDAFTKEPGDNAASVINAITRAAHESTWKTKWHQTDLEEKAGELLYQGVYRIDVPTAGAYRQMGLN